MLRFAPRHVSQTVFDFTVGKMNTLGWSGPDVPFGAAQVQFFSAPVRDNLDTSRLQPNSIAIYSGVEQRAADIELGGGLQQEPFVMFAEVYGENTGIAVSIASDIRDIWMGKHGNSVLTIKDYGQQPPVDVSGWYLDLGISVERGPLEGRLMFQVVASYAELVFPLEQELPY